MTDAPERIALRWQPGAAVTNGPLMGHPDFTQYIRADVAAAMVAAEREACAAVADKVADTARQRSNPSLAFLSRRMQALAAAIRKRGQQ
jgi:hypothetical protein